MSYDLDKINGPGSADRLDAHRADVSAQTEALKKERIKLLGDVASRNSGSVPTVEARRIGEQARVNTSSVTAITETGITSPEDTVMPGNTVFSSEFSSESTTVSEVPATTTTVPETTTTTVPESTTTTTTVPESTTTTEPTASTVGQTSGDGSVTVNPNAPVRQSEVTVNMPPKAPGLQEQGQMGQTRGH